MYGLEKVTYAQGVKVTDAHRLEAEKLTRCESLECLDAAVAAMSRSVNQHGGTLRVVLRHFQEERGTIQAEMDALARRNLDAVILKKESHSRIMSRGVGFSEAVEKVPDTPEQPKPEEDDFLA